MAILLNPHITVLLQATPQEPYEAGTPGAHPVDLRLVTDLGLYTLAELEDLVGAVKVRIDSWVENNPPTEP